MDGKKVVKLFLATAIITSLLLTSLPTTNILGQAEIKPSNPKGWGMFFGTSGDVRIEITNPGVAVRIEVPREFLEGTPENYTSFIESNISNDYFYYYVFDQAEYYPYDLNAPYTIEIWNPPKYLSPDCTGLFYSFTAPKFVLLHGNRYRDGQWVGGLTAPSIAGIYNFTVRIATSMGSDGKPIFPVVPDKVLKVPVSMREDPSNIIGYISETDYYGRGIIRTKGVVYAIGVTSGRISRAYVDPVTGFFNITGLYQGEYRLEGSAGFFTDTGYAYAITEFPVTVTVGRGEKDHTLYSTFALERGCIINGSVTYVDAFNTANSIAPLDSPYLRALNYQGLNYTVEAYDDRGRIVASRTYKSQNIPTERYALLFRNGTRYVGYPALGTEYAGFGPGTYTIKIWVYGFTVPQSQVKSVTFTGYGVMTDVGESRLPYGAVVSGTIRLLNGPLILETPRESEVETYGSATGKHFGGNILVEMYRNDGVLKGLAVYNRTLPEGVVQYADFSSGDQTPLLKFYILGFSEHYNKSYAGRWEIGSYPGPSPWDYGLESGTYYIRVWTRGYVQEAVGEFSVGEGSNQTVTIDLQRGGATQVTVESWNTRVRTRRPQALQPWRYLGLCPAPRLRVYFYRDGGVEVGYTESILRLDFPGVTQTTATLNFTGHNWSIFEIIFRGYVPNALDAGNYTAKAYTYGYIEQRDASFYLSLGDLRRFTIQLFIAGEIHGSVPLEMNGLFVSLTENVTARPRALLGGSLKGANVTDVVGGSSLFGFSTAGFLGQGHFFYVDPDGQRWKDYGLDTGNYTVFVPEFGFDRMFMQILTIYADIPDLNTMVGVLFHIDRMVKIYGTISGNDQDGIPVSLVWASATSNARIAYSYDGDFALHVQNGIGPYTVTFSCRGYNDYVETVTTNNAIGVTVVLTQSGVAFP